ncbi:MAG TPA: HNH endonuclease, partial [Acidimicrobiaceae bacterium]|nr:HNH endonuclease [Acidimicrobiaceae bacterium]
MANSLILNATYEPLSIVSTRRAVGLVLGERA